MPRFIRPYVAKPIPALSESISDASLPQSAPDKIASTESDTNGVLFSSNDAAVLSEQEISTRQQSSKETENLREEVQRPENLPHPEQDKAAILLKEMFEDIFDPKSKSSAEEAHDLSQGYSITFYPGGDVILRHGEVAKYSINIQEENPAARRSTLADLAAVEEADNLLQTQKAEKSTEIVRDFEKFEDPNTIYSENYAIAVATGKRNNEKKKRFVIKYNGTLSRYLFEDLNSDEVSGDKQFHTFIKRSNEEYGPVSMYELKALEGTLAKALEAKERQEENRALIERITDNLAKSFIAEQSNSSSKHNPESLASQADHDQKINAANTSEEKPNTSALLGAQAESTAQEESLVPSRSALAALSAVEEADLQQDKAAILLKEMFEDIFDPKSKSSQEEAHDLSQGYSITFYPGGDVILRRDVDEKYSINIQEENPSARRSTLADLAAVEEADNLLQNQKAEKSTEILSDFEKFNSGETIHISTHQAAVVKAGEHNREENKKFYFKYEGNGLRYLFERLEGDDGYSMSIKKDDQYETAKLFEMKALEGILPAILKAKEEREIIREEDKRFERALKNMTSTTSAVLYNDRPAIVSTKKDNQKESKNTLEETPSPASNTSALVGAQAGSAFRPIGYSKVAGDVSRSKDDTGK